jgi:hypothetical protein
MDVLEDGLEHSSIRRLNVLLLLKNCLIIPGRCRRRHHRCSLAIFWGVGNTVRGMIPDPLSQTR